MPLLLLSLLFPFFSQAGFRVGNGGLGVSVGSEIHLLDLAEKPGVIPRSPSCPDQWVRAFPFSKIEQDLLLPVSSLALLLSRIERERPQVGRTLALALTELNWNLRSLAVQVTEDARGSHPNAVQIARRDGLDVTIDRELYALMPPSHRLALLLHEAVYPFVKDQIEYKEDFEYAFPWRLSSRHAKEVRRIVRDLIYAKGDRNLYEDMNIPQSPGSIHLLTLPKSWLAPDLFVAWAGRRIPSRHIARRICNTIFYDYRTESYIQNGPPILLVANLAKYNESSSALSERLSLSLSVNPESCFQTLRLELVRRTAKW